jgi:hypothetical protein
MHPAFSEYLNAIRGRLNLGAREHTHRPALQALLEALGTEAVAEGKIKVLNEPARTQAGAPDLVAVWVRDPNLLEGGLYRIVGHVETKDLGTDLDGLRGREAEQKERYLRAFGNLLYTDYLSFILYREGREAGRAVLARRTGRDLEWEDPGGTRELLRRFLEYQGERVGRAEVLTERLAAHARLLREAVSEALRVDREGELAYWRNAFKGSLLPDLQDSDFADLLAQTLAYGLFTARLYHDPARPFTYREAFWDLPATNPFLRDLFQSLAPRLAEEKRVAWVLESLSEVLERADMGEVLKDFARGNRGDPVFHFYEGFLRAYDPERRDIRGVYYTPDPVVRFIVRGVDHLLRERLGVEEGLAGEEVYLLDPATGTGTFPYHAIRFVYERLVGERGDGAWRSYAREKLLGRVFGLELMMAPYAIAHLKLGLELKELGVEPRDRLQVYLANTLDDPDRDPAGHGTLPFLEREARGAYEVRRHQPILVVMGNPPYSGHSANKGAWIQGKVQDYKQVNGVPLGEKNPKWLQDDYVKFIRWGEWRISEVEPRHGVLAYITNHAYLDNPTFRGMRWHLLRTFDEIYVLNLHGNARRRERSPDGGEDENVFDIQQGVAIAFFLRYPEGKHRDEKPARVFYADLWGRREEKERSLEAKSLEEVPWQEVSPTPPLYLFVPQDLNLAQRYQQGWSLRDIFPVNSVGIVTGRDHFAVAFTREELEERIRRFCDPGKTDEEVRREFFGERGRGRYPPGDNRDWRMAEARRRLCQDPNWPESIRLVLYRPFDQRWILYHRNAIDFGRWEVMRHLLAGENIALLSVRQISGAAWRHVFCSKDLAVDISLSTLSKEAGGYVFPLYLYPYPNSNRRSGSNQLLNNSSEEGPRPNLSPAFVEALKEATGLDYDPLPSPLLSPGEGERFTPLDVLAYVYAVLHTPSYRETYLDFLGTTSRASPFPRTRRSSGRRPGWASSF